MHSMQIKGDPLSYKERNWAKRNESMSNVLPFFGTSGTLDDTHQTHSTLGMIRQSLLLKLRSHYPAFRQIFNTIWLPPPDFYKKNQ